MAISTSDSGGMEIPPAPEAIRSVKRQEWQLTEYPLERLSIMNKAEQGFVRWMNQIAAEINTHDMRLVYHALRGVLFTLRDRLTQDEVFDFASQLPVIIRGILFEGYDPKEKPVKINASNFKKRVEVELGDRVELPVEFIIRGVIRVIGLNISEGELQDIQSQMPKGVRELLFGRSAK